MRKTLLFISAIGTWQLVAAPGDAEGGPYEGGTFKGRIAYSADGNHNDPDDWAASPVALAILAECGLKDRLVHFHYNCILPLTDPEWENAHAEGVLGAADRYGYDRAVMFDCRRDLDAAVAGLAEAIDASSADDPLYFITAGPMEVPLLGIERSDPAKRRFVYCVSHSQWNDGYNEKPVYNRRTKRDVIATGVNWVQIEGQSRLCTSPYGRVPEAEEWQPWHWMRDSSDGRVTFLWKRMRASTRPDCSDAGMAYFVATGDEAADPEKLRRLLQDHDPPQPIAERARILIEAENFQVLDDCEPEYRNDRTASHRVCVRSKDETARVTTQFREPFVAASGRYDVDVRCFDSERHPCRFALLVNGAPQGPAWETPGRGSGWMAQSVRDVEISLGDELAVTIDGRHGKLDYVQLNAGSSLSLHSED